jgi:hypothetical protein
VRHRAHLPFCTLLPPAALPCRTTKQRMRICCMLARSKRCARVSRGYMQAANVTARLPPLTSCAPPCVCFFLPLPFSPRRRLAVRGGRREAPRRGDPHGPLRMHQHKARLTQFNGLPPVSRLFGVRGMQRARASRLPGLRAATARKGGPRPQLALAGGCRGLGSQWARP